MGAPPERRSSTPTRSCGIARGRIIRAPVRPWIVCAVSALQPVELFVFLIRPSGGRRYETMNTRRPALWFALLALLPAAEAIASSTAPRITAGEAQLALSANA